MCVTSLVYYSSSDYYSYLLENMVHFVIDRSHVAEICSYRTHISTVIHIVRLSMCRDSAAQDDSQLPLMALWSYYLCLAPMVRKVRILFRTLTCFLSLPTTSLSGLIRISVFDFLQIPCRCSMICSGCNAATWTHVARARLDLCTCSGDGLLGTQYEKPAEHDPHLHLIAYPAQESSASHTVISL
jgi:hypothetical protein